MKISAIMPNIIHRANFTDDVDQKDYILRNIEYFNAINGMGEPLIRPAVQVINDEEVSEQMEAEKMRAEFISREAKIKQIKELTGVLEPKGPIEVRPKKEYKKGGTIDIKV